jgi:hypothetical protein
MIIASILLDLMEGGMKKVIFILVSVCSIASCKVIELGDAVGPLNADMDYLLAWVSMHIAYVHDIDTYGKEDYWASPQETMNNGCGDCEDKAILFAFLVKRNCGIEVTFSNQNNHLACYYEGYYYDPATTYIKTTKPFDKEICKTPYAIMMAYCSVNTKQLNGATYAIN